MKPINFDKQNAILAENQKEYLPLPVYRSDDTGGSVTSCWGLTWGERFKLLFGGKFYISVLTFNQPPQPILPMVEFDPL